MNIIDALFQGQIQPNITFDPHSEHGKTMKQLYQYEDELIKLLDPPGQDLLKSLVNLQLDLSLLNAAQHFSYGFRLGVLLMTEVFTGQEDLVEPARQKG